ncbi:hypothetical protein GF374_03670 [Candidatus Woesearchaeota archaeon]|nr:hypothetical protein [Candidatus Woesearchaeota archaeon]
MPPAKLKGHIMTTQINELRELAAAAASRWTGCDWTTDEGRTGLDLDDANGAALRRAAEALDEGWDDDLMPVAPSRGPDELGCDLADWREAYIDDLRDAADWLERVAEDAAGAAAAADEIMAQIERGELRELAYHGSPCSIEAEYGACPAWRAWQNAAEEYLAALGEDDDA